MLDVDGNRVTVLRPDVLEVPRRSLVLARRGDLPKRPAVGLIANGKPLAQELLTALAAELQTRLHRDIDVDLLRKPSAAYPITTAQADGMAARAHVGITGVGD